LFVVGDELFDYEFRPENGLGNGLAGRPGSQAAVGPAPNLRRVLRGEFGGPDSHNCSSCHSKGGPDGAGHLTQNGFLRGDGVSTLAADARNPPHLLGLGPVEALAREMTAELQGQRSRAIAEARAGGRAVEARLESKGVRFGALWAQPDGGVDASLLEGIDPDLVVKPFGWKGHQGTIREAVEEAFRIHLGLVSMHDQERLRDGKAPVERYGDGVWYDADRDGATIEVDEGMLTTMVVYLSQLEAPAIRPPAIDGLADRFARGAALFEEVRCSSCHRPFLRLQDPVLAVRPRGADAAASEPIRVDVAADGEHPKIEPEDTARTAFKVRLFSDLKRHDLGPNFHERQYDGTIKTLFVTEPLWGVATTAPYGHDGRSINLNEVILRHGGEAQS
ncbi:MAG: di-heme oxidoredictase family protein, partial [Thermoanaerobaculia bacterium]